MQENKSNLICYETRKSNGEQILYGRKNGEFLCEAKFVVASVTEGERLVYHLKSQSAFNGEVSSSLFINSWTLIYYTIKNTKRLSPSRVKTEYNTKTIYLGWIDDINLLINQLIENYKIGRVMVGRNTWGCVPNAYTRSLYYRQAKRILSFENRARSVSSTDDNCPVRNMNPKLIHERVDFGDYCLECWGGNKKRKQYTYITFSKPTKVWLDKLCHQSI